MEQEYAELIISSYPMFLRICSCRLSRIIDQK